MCRHFVIDDDLNKRLATELRGRGRPASTLGQLGVKGQLDPRVLERVAEEGADVVLVTGDDTMPWEHGNAIERLGLTVVTVDGELDKRCAEHGVTMTLDQFRRESVHRHAHEIAQLEQGAIRRATPWQLAPWKVRGQHKRRVPRGQEPATPGEEG